MSRALLAVGLALGGCATSRAPAPSVAELGIVPGTPGRWTIYVGARSQAVPARALGLADDAEIAPGQLWLVLGDVPYPLLKGRGSAEVRLVSPLGASGSERAGFHQTRPGYHFRSGEEPGTRLGAVVRVRLLVDPAIWPGIAGPLQDGAAPRIAVNRLA